MLTSLQIVPDLTPYIPGGNQLPPIIQIHVDRFGLPM